MRRRNHQERNIMSSGLAPGSESLMVVVVLWWWWRWWWVVMMLVCVGCWCWLNHLLRVCSWWWCHWTRLLGQVLTSVKYIPDPFFRFFFCQSVVYMKPSSILLHLLCDVAVSSLFLSQKTRLLTYPSGHQRLPTSLPTGSFNTQGLNFLFLFFFVWILTVSRCYTRDRERDADQRITISWVQLAPSAMLRGQVQCHD